MLTLFNTLVALVFSLSVVKGPAVFHTVASFEITGPYNGNACVLIFEDQELVAPPQCVDDPVVVEDGKKVKVSVELYGKVPGTYVLVGLLPDADPHVASDPITVTITESDNK